MENPRSSEYDSWLWTAAAGVALFAFATGCHCKSIYDVGVPVGVDVTLWDFPPYSSFYQDWADGLELNVNDTLYFTYDSTLHNVIQVQAQDELDNCRIIHPILHYDASGTLEISIIGPRVISTYYFMSLYGTGLDCDSGMKFNLSVGRPIKTRRGMKLGLFAVSPIDSSTSSIESPSPAPNSGDPVRSSAFLVTGSASINSSNLKESVPIIASIFIVLVLAIVGCILYCRRRRKKKFFRRYTQQNVRDGKTKRETHNPNGNIMAKASTKMILGGSALREQNQMKCKIFTLKELEIATSNFAEDSKLGEGGFGTVYKGILKDGQVVAVKRPKAGRAVHVEEVINEVSILSQLNHRNLVKLLGCCMDLEVPLLVFEFISNGTLKDHLRKFREGYSTELDWQRRFNIALQTAEALKYLHSQAQPPIIHRDVKAANILLDNEFGARVADFGISKFVDDGSTHVFTEIKGTPGYLDPEYSLNGQLTDKSDVYSYGMVLLELITSKKPIDDDAVNLARKSVRIIKMKRAREIIDRGLVKEFSEGDFRTVEDVAEVAVACLEKERVSRPTMSEVAEMLQKIKGSSLKADTFFRRDEITNSGLRQPSFSSILRPFDSMEQSPFN